MTRDPAELDVFRSALRRLLEDHWVPRAAEAAADPAARRDIWTRLAGLGLALLGADPGEGGWPEKLLALEELGRAACPAPLVASMLAQQALAGQGPAADLLRRLRSGTHTVAWAFGALDGDAGAGRAELRDGRLHGTLRHVEGALDADDLLVLLDAPARVAVVSLRGDDTTVQPQPGLAVPPLAQVELRAAAAAVMDIDPGLVAELDLLARLCLLARAHGAARRMFELAVDYAGLRRQFGKPIGSFQAIQHKLADAFTALEASAALLRNVARWRDAGLPQWKTGAWCALAYAGTALRQVAMDAHQTFGAVGYDEDHELPRHFRAVHSDTTRHGGAPRAARELGTALLAGRESLPQTDLGERGNLFSAEVRQWLLQHWSAERRALHDARPYAERALHAEFEKALGEQGWLGISWPRAHGGQERSPYEQLAYIQELERVDAPGLRFSLQAPALMKFGTPEQQAFYLPRLLRGEIRICLGYSEPESGSDLASLRTSAVREGDGWRIDGQKMWSTHAMHSDYVWLAARTGPEARPAHAGIGMFIVPLRQAGVTVRPSMAMYGRTFSTIFFDGVLVPGDALVGEAGAGWKILTAALAEERMLMGSVVYRCRRLFEGLVEALRADPAQAADAGVRDRLGALAARIEVARTLLVETIDADRPADVPAHAAAMSKVFSAELMQALGEAALDLLGTRASLGQYAPAGLLNGELEQLLRHSLMYTIGGGTQEIQRTLIATRGLGLPRG